MVLLKTIRECASRETALRVILLGLDNAGKSTIVHQLLSDGTNFDKSHISPTLGFEIKSLTLSKEVKADVTTMLDLFPADIPSFMLEIWDIGGQRSLRPFWQNCYSSSHGIIWVVDSRDSRRLTQSAEELRGIMGEEALVGSPLLIMVNKQDQHYMSEDEAAKLLGLNELKLDRPTKIWRCCALTDHAEVVQAFQWLVDQIVKLNYFQIFDSNLHISIQNTTESKKTTKTHSISFDDFWNSKLDPNDCVETKIQSSRSRIFSILDSDVKNKQIQMELDEIINQELMT